MAAFELGCLELGTAIANLALHVVANRSRFPKDVLDLREPALDVVEKVSLCWRVRSSSERSFSAALWISG